MSADNVHNDRLGLSQLTPSATVSSSTTIISSAGSASISQHCKRSMSISEKEFELGLAAIQKEQGMGHEDYEEHFEVYWDSHNDPDNPQNWALWKRACILVAVSFQTAIV